MAAAQPKPHQKTEDFGDLGKYVGQMLQGKAHGEGTYTWKNGGSYTGNFKEDKPHGAGKLVEIVGGKTFVYEGNFEEGVKSGKGKYSLKDGKVIYDGNWKNGVFEDDTKKAVYNFPDSEQTYKGQFKNGKFHGYGEMKWPSGVTYKGPWENDLMQGKEGELDFPNGQSYKGEFLNGKREGLGIQLAGPPKDGKEPAGMVEVKEIYKGNWKDNKRAPK